MRPCKAAVKTFRKVVKDQTIFELMESFDGLCYACGSLKDGGCEPDARNYKCPECGAMEVFGLEEAMIDIG